jgi:hypothetical protein
VIGRLLGLAVLATLVGVLWVRSCSGPDPVVVDVRLVAPRAEATPYRVEATIENRGQGSGDAQVTFRLRDAATGLTRQQEQRIALDRGERALVSAEIDAPPATYTPAVEASYPPR